MEELIPNQLELVPRQCRLQGYEPIRVPSFRTTGTFIAYSSPDSTWPVTRDLLANAGRSITIGIYDFDAGYVAETLKAARARDVDVTLMLDCDCLNGEGEVFDELAAAGCRCVPAPSCASTASHFFSSSHEKVVAIDDSWVLVQSGNWTPNSIPKNDNGPGTEPFVCGNRDMGLAVESPELTTFFRGLLESDIDLELTHGGGGRRQCKENAFLQFAVDAPARPRRLFPSQRFDLHEVEVRPVLSPDNYMEVIPALLESARKSIRIEQQYIKALQPHIGTLLDAVDRARRQHSDLEVKIILARGFDLADLRTQVANLEERGFYLGTHVRVLNPAHFVHCHNKLIAVDDELVLISSQNWSDSAVAANREAGLLVQSQPLTRFYAEIFDADWDDALQALPPPRVGQLERAKQAGRIDVNPGDLIEV